MKGAVRLVEACTAVLLLLVPALWNRFPFLEYDTGGYLARWYEGYLVLSRSTVYGLFAVAGWPLDFWPVVALQAAAAVYVIALVLRVYGFGGRPFALLGIVAVLAVATSLPFLAGILLTDIFAGTAVLALHLLLFAPDRLGRAHRTALVLLVAFCAATHSATFAVLLAILAAAAIARLWLPAVALWRGAVALGLGTVMLLGTNFALSGTLAWTPDGFALVFARMLQDGIVTRYLNDHCPNPSLRLCAYRDKLPQNADDFLWGGGPFEELGQFEGLGPEMSKIALASLVEYPLAQLKAAVIDTAEQLVLVESGEGVENYLAHTYGIIEHYMPSVVPAMLAARQQHDGVSFRVINELHVPVALLSLALLPFLIAMARRRGFTDLSLLAATIAVALVTNAAVCGALSNPHSRYGARLVWIATLAVALVPMRIAAMHAMPAAVEAAPAREPV